MSGHMTPGTPSSPQIKTGAGAVLEEDESFLNSDVSSQTRRPSCEEGGMVATWPWALSRVTARGVVL